MTKSPMSLDDLSSLWYRHHIFRRTLASLNPNCLAEYIMAANGVFLRATRPGLTICLPVMQPMFDGNIQGLQSLSAQINLTRGIIPRCFLETLFIQSQQAFPHEKVFYLESIPSGYHLTIPQQIQSLTYCQPSSSPSYQSALLEIHSHGAASAFFSDEDDADETLFRIYAVLGKVNQPQPQIAVRVGFYGKYWLIPATQIFDLPSYLIDVHSPRS